MELSQIQIVEVDFQELERVEKPEIVYKYRSWNSGYKNSDNVLLENQLYMAEPDSFIDEFDCKIPIRYDLFTNKEILEWGFKVVKRQHPRWNDNAIKTEVLRLKPNLPFGNEERMKAYEIEEWKSYNSKAGVLSLCIQPLNKDMWEMYADNHKGICYGFEANELIRACKMGGGGRVIYLKELPIIHPNEDIILQNSKRVYCKLENWSFEEEYRMRTFEEDNVNKLNRIKKYPNQVLKQVVLGKDFNEEQIPRIKSILKEKGSHATLHQCYINDDKLLMRDIDY